VLWTPWRSITSYLLDFKTRSSALAGLNGHPRGIFVSSLQLVHSLELCVSPAFVLSSIAETLKTSGAHEFACSTVAAVANSVRRMATDDGFDWESTIDSDSPLPGQPRGPGAWRICLPCARTVGKHKKAARTMSHALMDELGIKAVCAP